MAQAPTPSSSPTSSGRNSGDSPSVRKVAQAARPRKIDGATEITGVLDNAPPGGSPADNQTGWRMALGKLAALVEADAP